MRTYAVIVMLLAAACVSSAQQPKFRTGIFLHHSTGYRIWGPNSSSTSMPAEFAAYNRSHALAAGDTFALTERHWPPTPDNEWSRWHAIFENRDTAADIRQLLAAHKIVMIKSCFPSSQLWGEAGKASDTLTPNLKSIANYKWHWRHIASAMRNLPENFFVIWTNAPLAQGVTTPQQAAFSAAFCRWAADTLARGLDPAFGAFPKNIVVFNIFHILAGTDGILPPAYAVSPMDSHPNSAATVAVAPLLVLETIGAALQYEQDLPVVEPTAVPMRETAVPRTFTLQQNFPNPFNPSTSIDFGLPAASRVRLQIFNLLGQQVVELVNGEKSAGWHRIAWTARSNAGGVYFCRLDAAGDGTPSGGFVSVRRMLLLK